MDDVEAGRNNPITSTHKFARQKARDNNVVLGTAQLIIETVASRHTELCMSEAASNWMTSKADIANLTHKKLCEDDNDIVLTASDVDNIESNHEYNIKNRQCRTESAQTTRENTGIEPDIIK